MKKPLSRRVVVTGMGTVNPCGLSVDQTWSNLIAGRSGIGPITRFDVTDYASKIAGEVKGFEIDRFVDKKEQKKMDIFIQYAVAAAAEAMSDAGFTPGEIPSELKDRFGVYIGSGIGGLNTIWNESSSFRGPRRISPFFIPSLIINMASGFVSIRYGLRGPNSSVATACATGNHSIGDASRLIASGHADCMIAGGSDSVINPLGVGGFAAMRALSTRNDDPERASRPFDKNRDGFVIAEGAGVVVLEEYESAKARGAKIYAEVLGYGMTGDAYHITSPAPEGDGGRRVMSLAIEDAGLQPSDIGYINMHGTSTPVGDQLECKAVQNVFGAHVNGLCVSSTKSMHGHLLGAAGGLESIITIKAMNAGVLPPTINIDNQDPECPLDVIANVSRNKKIKYALNNGFGFGGTNSCLVFASL